MHVTDVFTRKLSPARLTAFQVLTKIAEGAYASDALREHSRTLASRDAGLAAQIVFGCLRYESQLDYLIYHYSGRKVQTLDLPVQLALRAAILQLRYLERVPPHAAVHESVEYVKSRKRSAAGFTNAVLRKVDRRPLPWPDLATEVSCPAWMLNRWSAHFGSEISEGIARAALAEPLSYVRIAPGAPLPPDWHIEPTAVPGAWRLLSDLPPDTRLHDISSQAILPLLDLTPGATYLDLCAAPGNKTLQALETPLQLAVACDISPKRIREIPSVLPRVLLDATLPLPFGQIFDRIFIDAPCSGTGTLGRNPEIKWRLTPHDFERFHHKQFAIVSRALEVLAPSGKLVYATCSLEPEENENVIRRVLEAHPALQLTSETWRIPGRDEGDGFYAAVLQFAN